MKKAIVFLAVALAIPTSVAFGKAPGTSPNKGGKSAPKVQYVLKGTLSAYTAFDKSTNTNGTITIDVKHSNYHAKALKNASLTFTLTANSKVTFRHKSTLADSTATANGVITIRAPKKVTGDLASQLPGLATRIHVVVLKDLTA
jgi:hypothetical protein